MSREIGSEFQRMPIESGRGLTFPRSGSFVFSGRTAIEAVLKQLPDAHTALLPSYCCDSMIEPFRSAGKKIDFYDVNWDDGITIAVEDTADIILWCNYFGFKNKMPSLDGVIIEDITHSLLSEVQCHQTASYLVASLRKWEPTNCGGYCSVEVKGTEPPEEFIRLKSSAMELKAQYLRDLDPVKKPQFLQMFADSNRWLAKHYSGLGIDSRSRMYFSSINMEKQREIRRKNAHVLYEGLKSKVRFLFPEEDMDCPLFVPILTKNRDDIRRHLTKKEIYCPVHWPKPEGCESNIYDMELSLVCDQRYGIKDMERIVSALSEML